MSTTLEITFRCMCLFVTDPKNGRVHVLMPATSACCHAGDEASGGDGAGNVEKHVVRLVFPQAGGRLNEMGDAFVEDGPVDFREMEGWSLLLPGTGAGADSTPFPPQVADLGAVTKKKIKRALLKGPRDSRVASRITLDGGRLMGQTAAATWKFGGQELAQEVMWIIEDLPDGPLAWSRTRLKGPGERLRKEDREQLPPLLPGEDGVIRIEVRHVTERDFPRPQDRTPQVTAEHFAAFYSVFDKPKATPVPEFVRIEHHGTAGCLGAVATTV